ncbi:MAG: pitrilysin family protein [Desulfosarcinaceae bacterium]|nr:pitrilysin family protein [Desulfosarcinaceae bacterium]
MDPRIANTTLGNGVQILTKQMPHVRSVSMGVWANVGARDETASQSGLSHFIEHMIFKGTARRSALEIAKAFDAIGGHTNAFTAMEHTCYHARVLDSHLETMIDILSDIFLNSQFAPAEVEKERPVIFQEIGMSEDSPEDLLHQNANRHFWGDTPLGRSILGTPENIARFDAQTIKDYFNSRYQAERIIISLAGNIDHDRVVTLLAPRFETLPKGEPLPPRLTPASKRHCRIHSKSLEQSHICLMTEGLSSIDDERFALTLLNTLLGGNMSSRLFQKIRESHGLAYSVYSFISAHMDTGMFGAYTAVAPEKAAAAVTMILEELHRLGSQPVETEELVDAKEFIRGNLYLADESVDNQMVRLAQNEIYFGRHIPLSETLSRFEQVEPEEIRTLAARLFDPSQLSLTVLGPAMDTKAIQALITV